MVLCEAAVIQILTKYYKQALLFSGNFTVLEVTLKFKRQTGFYVIRLFVPSAMLVCLSWVAFFVSPTEVGDRLAIGITLILSMIFLLGYVDSSLPKVSYVKAVDWYLIMALIMIVSSVMETVLLYWYIQRRKKKALAVGILCLTIFEMIFQPLFGANNKNMDVRKRLASKE